MSQSRRKRAEVKRGPFDPGGQPDTRVGQPLELKVDAFPGRTFTATVSRISPAVNTQTRTFAFEALAPNNESLLKPGTFARVHLFE